MFPSICGLKREPINPFPPFPMIPEVNQVFGVYASRLGNWTMATSYWTKALVLDPNYVPAIVSMGEALLNENQISEARVYLDRAAKIDPAYWRTAGNSGGSRLADGRNIRSR